MVVGTTRGKFTPEELDAGIEILVTAVGPRAYHFALPPGELFVLRKMASQIPLESCYAAFQGTRGSKIRAHAWKEVVGHDGIQRETDR
jgi:hypothetical protein